jgi:DNA-binding NarL/FixJ family response regulator
VKIAFVDDHPIVLQALKAIFEHTPDMEVLASSDTLEGLRIALQGASPEVLLLDLNLPEVQGLEALDVMRSEHPEAKILIFTGDPSDDRVSQALQSGAKGYLLKGAGMAEILRAVETVGNGGVYVEPHMLAKVLAHKDPPKPSFHLSERERQVLRLVAEGLPNKAIALRLKLSESTIKFHLSSIFSKLEVNNRAQAVAIATHEHLLEN